MEERDYDLLHTPVDTLVYNLDEHSQDELKHWGIKGMRWGVRRYQNKDGSLTNAGKKRRAKLETELKELSPKQQKRQKTPSEMTNKELEKYIARRNAERIAYGLDRDISTLQRQSSGDGQGNSNQNQNQQGGQQGNQQKKSVFKDQVLTPVAVDIGKKAMSKLGDTLLSKVFGEGAPDNIAALKKEVEKVELDKRLVEAKNAIKKATQNQEKSIDERIKEYDFARRQAKDAADAAAEQIRRDREAAIKRSYEEPYTNPQSSNTNGGRYGFSFRKASKETTSSGESAVTRLLTAPADNNRGSDSGSNNGIGPWLGGSSINSTSVRSSSDSGRSYTNNIIDLNNSYVNSSGVTVYYRDDD